MNSKVHKRIGIAFVASILAAVNVALEIDCAPVLAGSQISSNDKFLPWIKTVPVPAGVTKAQLRAGVEVQAPADPIKPTQQGRSKSTTKLYSGRISYKEHHKYRYWIQDMSNGAIHAVASNNRGF